MNSPTKSTTDADHQAAPEKPTGGYMSNMYDSVSSTAQAAYNQIPSLDPLRALLPGHQDSATNELVAEKSQDGSEEKGDQASNLPVQPPTQPEAAAPSDASTKVNRPTTERSESSFNFVPHQAAAHSSSASSISRDSSTQGIHCTSPDYTGESNEYKDPDSTSHVSYVTTTTPASAISAKSGQYTPSASEQIKADALQSQANFGAPLAAVKSAPSMGSKENLTANQPSTRAVGDMEHEESNVDDDGSNSDGEKGKRDKFKKRLGDLTDKVKAKLHK